MDNRLVCWGTDIPVEPGWYVRELHFSNMENREPFYTVWEKIDMPPYVGDDVAYQRLVAQGAVERRGETAVRYEGYDGRTYPREFRYVYIGD